MDLDAVKTSYARWAPIYDKTFGAITYRARKRTVAYINKTSGPRVLEVGVGTGLALPYYKPDLQITAFDYSEDMLTKARKKAADQNLKNVELLQMDARQLDFSDNHFDTVVAMHIVSVVPEPERVVAEMARVCKPGGRIVITNHFAREKGLLAILERVTAPLENLLGWHSDFDINTVLGEPNMSIIEQKSAPPLGMMTFLVLEKSPVN